MYAVIKTGGKQYKVASGDVVKLEKIAGEEGKEVVFNEVGKSTHIYFRIINHKVAIKTIS